MNKQSYITCTERFQGGRKFGSKFKESIHITCDAWTSSNLLAACGMVGHFTSEERKL